MLSSILAFIKAKAVIIAITSTVVVTTAVATPIVINEVKKQNRNEEAQHIAGQEVSEDNQELEKQEENNQDRNIIAETIVEDDEDTIQEQVKKETKSEQPTKNSESGTKQENVNTSNESGKQKTYPNIVYNYGGGRITIYPNGMRTKPLVQIQAYDLNTSGYDKNDVDLTLSQFKNKFYPAVRKWHLENIKYNEDRINGYISYYEGRKAIYQEALDYFKANPDKETYTVKYKDEVYSFNTASIDIIKDTITSCQSDINKYKKEIEDIETRIRLKKLDEAYNAIVKLDYLK